MNRNFTNEICLSKLPIFTSIPCSYPYPTRTRVPSTRIRPVPRYGYGYSTRGLQYSIIKLCNIRFDTLSSRLTNSKNLIRIDKDYKYERDRFSL